MRSPLKKAPFGTEKSRNSSMTSLERPSNLFLPSGEKVELVSVVAHRRRFRSSATAFNFNKLF